MRNVRVVIAMKKQQSPKVLQQAFGDCSYVAISVFYFVGLVAPFVEGYYGLVAHEVVAFNGACFAREFYLVVNELVIEIDGLRIGLCITETDTFHTSPI